MPSASGDGAAIEAMLLMDESHVVEQSSRPRHPIRFTGLPVGTRPREP